MYLLREGEEKVLYAIAVECGDIEVRKVIAPGECSNRAFGYAPFFLVVAFVPYEVDELRTVIASKPLHPASHIGE